ncbi:MAG TPA: YihA family ribosome biogenesis GTP-binding protein [Bacteroidetes bacterium]|nr:YihA family ribosome biogenesis GTP-binding protein [Bacteroidota bacterium]
MVIRRIKFTGSSPSLKLCPSEDFPEYAFTGRSNVGKSSLINMLCQRKSLARISSTPGKTQLINHFLINDEWYLADLPGYGYAKTGKKKIGEFEKLVIDYILYRENLMSLFLLIDARHPDLDNDKKFMDFLGVHGIPFVIVFTKADKLSSNQVKKSKDLFLRNTLQRWETSPDIFLTSARNRLGREEVLDFIERTNLMFKKR